MGNSLCKATGITHCTVCLTKPLCKAQSAARCSAITPAAVSSLRYTNGDCMGAVGAGLDFALLLR